MYIFAENSKGQFSELFLKSIDRVQEKIDNASTNHLKAFFIIAIIVVIFMLFIIFDIIIPYTTQSFKFVKSITGLYRTLPSKDFFNDQINEYSEQIQEICDNYEVEDEGIGKRKRKNKKPSTIRIKKLFIIYSFIVAALILLPFTTVFVSIN
ncbi:hypothetical protein BCR36DRAFT_33272 [Piromyces finnis]|uniref:Uncharacterized protein n=1 Tax=Piromyces finnis TaxID=1754191 RepID=A0A1Y1VCQ8_9FUNG|nr:hypothetical protein BCR36DRAFT_33272 [Piromyces finnis]|eukprot:ORX52084.1 hypothetical protein BCR36DRAFT_33272 [Piromyces finnis]